MPVRAGSAAFIRSAASRRPPRLSFGFGRAKVKEGSYRLTGRSVNESLHCKELFSRCGIRTPRGPATDIGTLGGFHRQCTVLIGLAGQ
jgi:hypothetical protein